MKSSHPLRCPRRTYPDTRICVLAFSTLFPFCLIFPFFRYLVDVYIQIFPYTVLVNKMPGENSDAYAYNIGLGMVS